MTQLRTVFLSLLAGVLVSTGCAFTASDLKAPILEGLSNPDTIDYSGLTHQEFVDIAVGAVIDLGLETTRVDRSGGYVETAFTDFADFAFLNQRAGRYPARERFLQVQFQVRDAGPESGTVEMLASYQPFRPGESRAIPEDHPGFAILSALVRKVERGIIQAGGSMTRRSES